MALDGGTGQKSPDLSLAEVNSVIIAMERDELPDPVHAGVVGADAVMSNADAVTDVIEHAPRSGWRGATTRIGEPHVG